MKTFDEFIKDRGLGKRLLRLDLPMAAQSQERSRMTRNGRMYTPAKTREYHEKLKAALAEVRGGDRTLHDCQMFVRLTAVYKPPKSFNWARLRLAHEQYIFPTNKDWDNLGKAVCDALNGELYVDDRFIAAGHVEKIYGREDRLVFDVFKIGLSQHETQQAERILQRTYDKLGDRGATLGEPRNTRVPLQLGQNPYIQEQFRQGNDRPASDRSMVQEQERPANRREDGRRSVLYRRRHIQRRRP